METKKCNQCREKKPLDKFYYRENRKCYEGKCLNCYAKNAKEKRKDPIAHEKLIESLKRYYNNNKQELNEQCREYQNSHKEDIAAKKKLYYNKNAETLRENQRIKNQKIKESVKEKKPNINNKTCTGCKETKSIECFTFRRTRNKYESTCKTCNMVRERKRRALFPEYIKTLRKNNYKNKVIKKTTKQRILSSLRKRLNHLVKNRSKKNLYLELLGCNYDFLKRWFEFIFKLNPELNWDNYGKIWQTDHVIPCASFDLENKDDQKRCFHWTNLRPTLASYNLAKQNKIFKKDIFRQKLNVVQFLHNEDLSQFQYNVKP